MTNPQSLHALLEQTGWMHALARRLVADPHLAADLAQDAALDALERQPDGGRPLRGWLATVMRNKLSKLHRGERHRAAREDAARRSEPEPAALDVVERAETHRNVVLAVLALPEPYKSTLLLRFFEQLSYDEIARRTGVTRATVNSRVTRGLAELRQRLESSYGGDRRALGLALIPLAKLPKGVATTTILGLKTMHFATATTVATLLVATGSVALLKSGPEPVSSRPVGNLSSGSALAQPTAEPRATELLAPPPLQASEPSEPARVALAPEDQPVAEASSIGQESDEDVWRTEVFQAMPLGSTVESLSVNTGAGDVEVRASTSGQLEILAKVRAKRKAVKSNELTQVFQDHVEVLEEKGVLTIKDAHEGQNGWSVGFVVSVPAQLPLGANSGSGDVVVRTGSGYVKANTGSGDVLVQLGLERLKRIDANTGSGDVEVEVSAIEDKLSGNSGSGDVTLRVGDPTSPGVASLSSGSGNIHLVVPHGINGSFGLRTHGGEILLPASLGIQVEQDAGGGSRAEGRLGNGIGKYDLSSGSGDLEIQLGNAMSKNV